MVSQPSDDPGVVRRTQRFDIARSVPAGVLVPIETSIVLTIAITRFDAAGWVKGLIAAAAGVGMLSSPFITASARRSQLPVMLVAAGISVAGAVGFVLASTGALALMVVGSIIGVAAISASIPLLTATYERNFSPLDRGRRVGRGMTVRVAVAALAGLAMGGYLTSHPDRWWHLTLVAALAMATIAVCQVKTPSHALTRIEGRTSSLPHFHLIAEDRQLRLTLIAWMFMGFGNLMLLPLRVEYLARPAYGIEADAARITALVVTIPSIVRLVCIPIFGSLFDRLSFFSARIMVNLCFGLYIIVFFFSSSTTGLVLGAVAFGIGGAGGDLMWTLWVTKFAPPSRVADYMGLHTFFTGIRAVAAPVLGFLVVERFDLGTVALIATSLIVVSSLILLPEARSERRARIERTVVSGSEAAGPFDGVLKRRRERLTPPGDVECGAVIDRGTHDR
jgi:MFS family permease